ncbi:unnamed protein product [Linum tenue]|uniref:Outer envelope pore protein 21, chloroplastic n=1 Tax=Linum tenue TaxID=586396 RepID=A0AAV0LML4_9ROSI|nr:unnamed protein product [Linum tenue]
METSLRYSGGSKRTLREESLRIHAKQKLFFDPKTQLQFHGELDTRIGAPSHVSAILRHFLPDVRSKIAANMTFFSTGTLRVQYDKQEKLRYSLRGKKAFPITSDGMFSFNVKGRYHLDKDFKERKPTAATELSCSIFNFQKDQDVRIKVGYEVIDKLPYLQIRENNWTFNADLKGRWNVRYDL